MYLQRHSLTDAFTEIGRNFEAANPGVTAPSTLPVRRPCEPKLKKVRQQMSLPLQTRQKWILLVTDSFVAQDVPQNFLTNKLVVILPADNPAGLGNLEDLAKPGIKLVLAAEEVPVGKYAARRWTR